MKIVVDINKLDYDEMMATLDLFSGVDLTNIKSTELGEKYKMLLAHFAFDDEGQRMDHEEAEKLIGKSPAIDMMPLIPAATAVVQELSEMMKLPNMSGGS